MTLAPIDPSNEHAALVRRAIYADASPLALKAAAERTHLFTLHLEKQGQAISKGSCSRGAVYPLVADGEPAPEPKLACMTHGFPWPCPWESSTKDPPPPRRRPVRPDGTLEISTEELRRRAGAPPLVDPKYRSKHQHGGTQ